MHMGGTGTMVNKKTLYAPALSPDLALQTYYSSLRCSLSLVVLIGQEEFMAQAKEAAEERRGTELGDLPTEPGRHGVFAWLHNGPRTRQRATLAYNKACGNLR